MQKCIIISIRPEWVEKILNGEKTIEIRKSMPKCDYPIDVYIYCTKGKNKLRRIPCYYPKSKKETSNYKIVNQNYNTNEIVNGKIVAKFTLNKIDTYRYIKDGLSTRIQIYRDDLEKTCLKPPQIFKYANGKSLYGWHIDNLEIFNKPMVLSEFYRNNFEEDKSKPCCCGKKCQYESYDWCEHQSICSIDYDGANCPFLKVSKPPQSWCYAWR